MWLPSANVALASEVQLRNTFTPIDVTLAGIVMEDSDVQSLNTLSPRVVIPEGIVMPSKEEHA